MSKKIIKKLRKTLEANMNRFHRMWGADKNYSQKIYVGAFDFTNRGKVGRYAYVSHQSYSSNLCRYVVTCKRVDKDEDPTEHPNHSFEFEIVDFDQEEFVVRVTKYLG